MKFKVGDRVKFLNESGGGVVSKIVNPKMVNVMIEDGFEIPVLIAELLKIEIDAPVDSPVHMFREDFNTPVPVAATSAYESDDRNIRLAGNRAKGTVAEGIYFAFVQKEKKWLITGLIDIYLVNNTNVDILYSVFLEKEQGGFTGFDYGSAESNAMVLLESLEREKLNKWEKGVVQVLFHPESDSKLLAPGNSGFRIKLSRFYIESSYKDSAIINGKSVLISLIPLSSVSIIRESDDPLKGKEEVEQVTVAEVVEPENVIDKHRTSPREAIVDLHIGELVDNISGMDSAEMIRTQLNYFTRCLENGIANKIHKITFIHGVGAGVLKKAIQEVLKDYPNIQTRDASLKQFGYGAMDVIIHN